jgi:prevent-host-death family protein
MSGETVLDVADQLAALVHRVATDKERVVLTGEGGDKAALVPVEDLNLLEEIEDQADVRDALGALEEPGDSIPWEKVKADLGL